MLAITEYDCFHTAAGVPASLDYGAKFYTRIEQYSHSKHREKHREYIENTGETQKKYIGKIRLKGWFPIHRKHMVKKTLVLGPRFELGTL